MSVGSASRGAGAPPALVRLRPRLRLPSLALASRGLSPAAPRFRGAPAGHGRRFAARGGGGARGRRRAAAAGGARTQQTQGGTEELTEGAAPWEGACGGLRAEDRAPKAPHGVARRPPWPPGAAPLGGGRRRGWIKKGRCVCGSRARRPVTSAAASARAQPTPTRGAGSRSRIRRAHRDTAQGQGGACACRARAERGRRLPTQPLSEGRACLPRAPQPPAHELTANPSFSTLPGVTQCYLCPRSGLFLRV